MGIESDELEEKSKYQRRTDIWRIRGPASQMFIERRSMYAHFTSGFRIWSAQFCFKNKLLLLNIKTENVAQFRYLGMTKKSKPDSGGN
jgi:hypothetical protein